MGLVDVGSLSLWVEEAGEGDPVLLIMGLGSQHLFWPDALVDALVAAGHRVIRFDNRDVGWSTKLDALGVPPIRAIARRRLVGLSTPVPYGLEEMADDAVGVLEVLGVDRAHVVGASMGGMIAQLVAIRHPDRVRTLTSVMSHTGELSHLLVHPKAARVLLQAPPRTVDEATRVLLETFRAVGTQPFDEAALRPLAERHAQRNFHPPGSARQLAASITARPRTRALGALRMPALVVHGDRDPLVPLRGGLATARAIPGATLSVYRGFGHDIPRVAWRRLADDLSAHLRRG